MKTKAIQRLRKRISEDQTVLGLWVTLESPSITEMAVALGLDWVVIDAEHGHLDWKEIIEHVRATVRSDTVALVRIASNDASLCKRALDIGADGVVIPWIEDAAGLEKAVAACRYPPRGVRGIGAERATCWGQCFVEHTGEADEHALVVPIIESVGGVKNVEELASADGAELFFFGPSDLSSTAGYPGQWEGPGVAEMILQAKDKLLGRGKTCGLIATDNDNLARRQEQGFRMLGIGIDGALLIRSMRQALDTRGRDRQMVAAFTVENDPESLRREKPVSCAPPHMRPDRREDIGWMGKSPRIELSPGVMFDCLVGKHNGARGLTTGIATLAPGAVLPGHRHQFPETITAVSGEAVVDVEGRMYRLVPYDNVTVPAGMTHRVSNSSGAVEARLHVAIPAESPDREWVDRFYARRSMPMKTGLRPEGEYVTAMADAKIYQPGDNASFVDYFNENLIPGFPMSGGYGRFGPGGRLPAHLHDFDESICIVEGKATCVVEGRRYSIGDLGSAIQPRGRIHYFINETQQPMSMIWVYAGGLPERLVVDERCAVEKGCAWGEA